MTNPEVAILMLCLFIVLVLLGFPIAFTLIAMGVGFGYYAYYQAPESFGDLFNNQIFYLLNQNTYSVMENDTLVAIPLFLFMGYVVERADIVGTAVPVPANGRTQPPRLNGDRGLGHLRSFLDSIWHRGRSCHPDGAPGIPCHGQCQL